VYTATVQETPKVTAADIARLAGVGRAAVSNWRKRHVDFPEPVSGTASSPEFNLAQVEEWLRGQGKLPDLSVEDRAWSRLVAAGDDVAVTLGRVGLFLLNHQHSETSTNGPVSAEIAELAADRGAEAVYEEFWRRFAQTHAWRVGVTPEPLTDLMIGLTGRTGGSVLDPACGTGNILRAAARAGCTAVYGQEIDADSARLIDVWLALRGMPSAIKVGDSLRADAFPELLVDAVVSNLPFGDTNWGHDELGYDPRWEYGAPPRTEPELAWVQHAIAHLRPGGVAVLLMPPSAASRRAGRRIRSELLRRGALRAVIALPAKAAAPHAVPLHLWLLTRPAPQAAPPAHALLIDAGDGDTAAGYARILAAFRLFAQAPDASVDEPGFARAVPVIELLDEDVDLTPARRQPHATNADSAAEFAYVRDQLTALLADLRELVPDLGMILGPTAPPVTSVSDLAKSGALQILGPVRPTESGNNAGENQLVLTGQDVIFERGPSGRATDRLTAHILLRPGDVVVPTVARQLTARVIVDEDALLGANLYLLRPNPAAVDPWFLAGQIRTAANERQAVSASGTSRFDVRRAQIPRLPFHLQSQVGEAFRRLAGFDIALRRTAALGADLVRTAGEGLARGVLQPQEIDIEVTASSSRPPESST
jgi:SAM-dependent methyltransferase